MMSSPYMLIIWQTKRDISINDCQQTMNVIFFFNDCCIKLLWCLLVRREDAGSIFTWSFSQFCSSSVPRSSRLRVCLLYVTMKPAIGAEASPDLYRVTSLLMSSPLKQKHQEGKCRENFTQTSDVFIISSRTSRTSRIWQAQIRKEMLQGQILKQCLKKKKGRMHVFHRNKCTAKKILVNTVATL